MAFAVPNPGDTALNPKGSGTYNVQYANIPDPALNLPRRFVSRSAGSGELEQWDPNQSYTRKEMRGLFFRRPTIDPASNTYLLQAFSPQDGDTVRIEPRIYNYSTQKAATNVIVQFQVIAYDSSLNSEICSSPINVRPNVSTGLVCPRAARTTIGTTRIARLNPLQFTCVTGMDDPAGTGCAQTSAYINWNTKGFGPAYGTQEYRVYVVLNPDGGAGQETYGLEPEPVRITNITNTTPMVITAPGNTVETGDYVTVGGVNGIERANGTWKVTLINNDEFSLDDSVTSRGAYQPGEGTVAILDPGQNNEGYGVIGVSQKASSMTVSSADPVPHDYLEGEALQGLTEQSQPSITGSSLSVVQDVPVDLRFTVHSTMVHTEAAEVLLFDGDPASGAPAIADQAIHPGSHGTEGTSIWFNWTPTTSGMHRLYAVLMEGGGKSQPASELEVDVRSK